MDPKDLLGIAVAFVVAVIALAIGADLVRDVQTDQTESVSGYFNNRTVALASVSKLNTTVGNAHTALHEKCSFTLASCRVFNASSTKAVIPTSNYTITSPSECVLYFRLKDNLHNESAKLVDCPYTAIGGSIYNITLNAQQGLEDFSNWLPTLALVVMTAIIIGTLILFMARRMM